MFFHGLDGTYRQTIGLRAIGGAEVELRPLSFLKAYPRKIYIGYNVLGWFI